MQRPHLHFHLGEFLPHHLTRAVKQARSRANDIEVAPSAIGEKLLNFVFNGK